MGKGDEDGFAQNVTEDREDKVVCRGAKLHIEEAPFVESFGVRVQNVGGVLVQADGALRDPDHFESGPEEGERHDDEVEKTEDDFGG